MTTHTDKITALAEACCVHEDEIKQSAWNENHFYFDTFYIHNPNIKHIQSWTVLTKEEWKNDPNGQRFLSEFDTSIEINGKLYYCFRDE